MCMSSCFSKFIKRFSVNIDLARKRKEKELIYIVHTLIGLGASLHFVLHSHFYRGYNWCYTKYEISRLNVVL